jgi:hypothetical protein
MIRTNAPYHPRGHDANAEDHKEERINSFRQKILAICQEKKASNYLAKGIKINDVAFK